MKLIGWAIALAAAGLTPAAAQAPQQAAPTAAAGQSPAAPQGDPAAVVTRNAPDSEKAVLQQPGGEADPAVNGAAPAAAASFPQIAADPKIGRPVGGKGLQHQVTDIGREAASFHNNWLLLLCAAISLLVLGLLGYAIVRFRRGANPVPSRTSHNTTIEVLWTVVPVLILVAIAIPSIRLLRHQYSPPPADLTVKVIGNQWYWTYQYPDNGGFEIVSNMLKEKADVPAGQRFRTDADPEARFAAWVASKGGTMPGARPAAAPDSTAASQVSTAATPAAAAPNAAAPQPTENASAAAEPAATN
jgi:cytochrome c oxidase subunit 2